MADTNLGRLAYIKETTFGTTPASGTLLTIEAASWDLGFMNDTVQSSVITGNRALTDQRRTNYRAEGNIVVGVCRDTWLDGLIEAALGGTLTGSPKVCKAGNALWSGYFEDAIDEAGTKTYHRYNGARINSFGFDCSFDGEAQMTFGILGANFSTNASATTLTAGPATGASKLMGLDLSAVTIAGVTGLEARRVSLNLANNLRTQGVVGQASARGIGYGRRVVTGQIEFYYEDLLPWTTLLTSTEPTVAISFTIGATTNGYKFDIARARTSVPKAPNPGQNNDYMVTVDFTATYDATDACDFKISHLA